jgi:hypothetical protein
MRQVKETRPSVEVMMPTKGVSNSQYCPPLSRRGGKRDKILPIGSDINSIFMDRILSSSVR